MASTPDTGVDLHRAPVVGVCEDDHELRGVIRQALERDGFMVRATGSGAEAARVFTQQPPDVLVLDVTLPDADGRDVCQALRARGVAAPVLFVTARDTLTDRLSGFHAGGDDYVTKPFALAELVVRTRALLRRTPGPGSAPAAKDSEASVVLDPAAHAVVHGSSRALLTPTEFRILAALAAEPGRVVRRAVVISAAWPDGARVHPNTLHAYIARLRRKLRWIGSPRSIATVRGVGYELR